MFIYSFVHFHSFFTGGTDIHTSICATLLHTVFTVLKAYTPIGKGDSLFEIAWPKQNISTKHGIRL